MTKILNGSVIDKIVARACEKAKHSWEYGAASEALLELYDPQLSVFSIDTFPRGSLPCPDDSSQIRSLVYARKVINSNGSILIDGDGESTLFTLVLCHSEYLLHNLVQSLLADDLDNLKGSIGDSAAVGVFAELIGQSDPSYRTACQRQADTVLSAPRWSNGAISHRSEYATLWADFVYMAPPFLAYHAVATNDTGLMKEAIQQCLLYSEALSIGDGGSRHRGSWRHIVGPQFEDLGLWATGNGWAAAGMTRVLATCRNWYRSNNWKHEQDKLTHSIFGILNGAVNAQKKGQPPMLCNFLEDASWFGDIASTAMLAAVAYRMMVLAPEFCEPQHMTFAEEAREAVIANVDIQTGRVTPTPQGGLPGWTNNNPSTEGSSQGHSFVVMMYSAYRDWSQASSSNSYGAGSKTGHSLSREASVQLT